MNNRFKVIPISSLKMSSLLMELPKVKTKQVEALVGPLKNKSDFSKANKYSCRSIVVEDVTNGEKFSIYTSYGRWRIGGYEWTSSGFALQKLLERK